MRVSLARETKKKGSKIPVNESIYEPPAQKEWNLSILLIIVFLKLFCPSIF